MSKPIIILAFANDKDKNYLEMIDRERQSIYQSLQDYNDKEYVQVEKVERTSIDDILDIFNRYDQVAIFHYGGHANGTHLQLEKAQANAEGLAQLMGRQQGLKLVFLNGCATYDQVSLLFAAGVKAVIATVVAIGDEKATQFAEKFYAALAKKKSIEAAFEHAKDSMTIQYGKTKEVSVYRGFSWRDKPVASPDMFPWGLYVNENAGDALEWKLPDIKRMVNIGVAVSGREAVPVNQVLIEMLSNELPRHSRKMAQFLEALESCDEEEKEDKERELPVEIMDSFPLPVGEQLRKLFVGNDIGVPRLQQIVVAYETMVELLCFAMLSQLWEDRNHDPGLIIPSKNQEMLQKYFELNAKSYPTFALVDLMAAVVEVFQKNNLNPFVEEFKNFTELLQQEEFRQAHLFLEKMRAKLNSERPAAEEIEVFCVQSEKCLGAIMTGFAFIVKYTLRTIKNIELIKYRHTPPKYRHTQVLLTRTTGREVMKDTKKEYEYFAECRSVILLKSVKELNHYLSLSPFVIDKSALTGGKEPDLYFYTFRDAAADSYHYQSIFNRKDTLLISENPDHLFIKQQFKAFRQAILRT